MSINRRLIHVTMIFASAFLLLSAILFSPGTAFADNSQPAYQSAHADDNQLTQLKNLWGKDVKYLEVIKTVAPGTLEGVSQRMIEQASASVMHWDTITKVDLEKLSDINIYWNYQTNDSIEWFWVSIMSPSKQIKPMVLNSLFCKAAVSSNSVGKEITVRFDADGKPQIGSIGDRNPSTSTGKVVREESTGSISSTSSSLNKTSLLDYTSKAHAKARTYFPPYDPITGQEAWQQFNWSGSYVTGIPSQGGTGYRYWPFWVINSTVYSDEGPTPPTWRHTTKGVGQFDYYQGGWAHEIDVWSYAYGDGTVNGAYNFSGKLPYDGLYTGFEYWSGS